MFNREVHEIDRVSLVSLVGTLHFVAESWYAAKPEDSHPPIESASNDDDDDDDLAVIISFSSDAEIHSTMNLPACPTNLHRDATYTTCILHRDGITVARSIS